MTFTVDDLQSLAIKHELLAAHFRVLGTKSGIAEFAPITLQYLNMAEFYRSVAERKLKEEKQMKRPSLITTLLVVFILSTLVFSVSAQESTDIPTPTQEVTAAPPEATPVVPDSPTVEEPGFNLGTFLLGVVTGVAGGLSTVFGIVSKLKDDKAALDAIEWLGKSIPVEALDKLNALGRNMRDAGEVIDRVTDGQPNDASDAGELRRFAPDHPY